MLFDIPTDEAHTVVEVFNNRVIMGSVNFSVPDDVKKEFNAMFRKQNKSAIIADLMREAVERARREKRSHEAVARIVSRQRSAPFVTAKILHDVRKHGRP